ncbi:hypothetical protein SAMN03159463_05890 [Mesorhizobium sp. NFR06]|uniref:hypothetical protein n=1 Tax=Mesorhizobium sp. NFR06 TaxID=1566290 RepID=UPI0008E93DD1|nr:hypothetical protein [Mesorhizobium sp. NFR06]SFQ18006.1 hypothetical protein SAMN03159463_05890 [Mesorhizobium sp. NFR06]
MKKSLLCALGLAVALAFSMPALGIAAATKTTAPAATTATPAPTTTMAAKPHKVATKKVCKPTKTHKCPVKHRKHTAKTAAPKPAY